jgi:hypothetical protein
MHEFDYRDSIIESVALFIEAVSVRQSWRVRDDELLAWSQVKPTDGGMVGYDELIFM